VAGPLPGPHQRQRADRAGPSGSSRAQDALSGLATPAGRRGDRGERAQAAAAALPDSRSLAAALRAPGRGQPAGVGSALLKLQRDHGNRYVQGVISRAPLEDAGPPSSSSHPRSAVADAAGAVDASLQRAIEGSRRGGRTLGQPTAAALGGALGREVSQVRVHDDAQADCLSRSLHAAAFTIGRDIFFRARHYHPGTTPGRRLLAHELAHVAQQQAGLRTARRDRLAPADDPGERAADRAADDMVLGGRAQPMTLPPQAPLIQRKAFIGPDPLLAKPAEFGDPLKEKPKTKGRGRRSRAGRLRNKGEERGSRPRIFPNREEERWNGGEERGRRPMIFQKCRRRGP